MELVNRILFHRNTFPIQALGVMRPIIVVRADALRFFISHLRVPLPARLNKAYLVCVLTIYMLIMWAVSILRGKGRRDAV